MKSYPKVTFLIINYNHTEVCLELIASIQNTTYPEKEVIVVDNDSVEDPTEILNAYPDVHLIKSDVNLGYAGGINLGLKDVNGKYLFILNSDVILTPNSVEPLVDHFESDPSAGMISPKVLYEKDKTIQFVGFTGDITHKTGRGFSISYQNEDDESTRTIREDSYVFGAAFMVPMELVKKICIMPDLYFLYYEELDWSMRFRNAGYKIFYNGFSTIYHKDSVTVGRDSFIQVYYMWRNRILFQRRNTKFAEKLVFFIYISFVGTPKQILQYLLQRKFSLAWAIGKAYLWNILNHNIHRDTSYDSLA